MSREPIRLDVVREGRMRTQPFAWTRLDGLLAPQAAQRLRAQFPVDGFERSERHSGDKSYALWARRLWAQGSEPTTAQASPPAWSGFVAALGDPSYRVALTGLTGVDVREAPLEVTLWRYERGCWLSPHLDKESKVVTQLFYFNERWDPAWGGCLRILRSADDDDVVEEVVPALNTSVVLVRSSSSWHSVAPVSASAHVPARLTATAIFYAARLPRA